MGSMDSAHSHGHRYVFECFDKDGNLKWREESDNLVVDEGLDDILTNYYKGSSYTATHYVGLTDSSPTIDATDTMGSHTGWAEVDGYSESTRPAFTPGTVSSQSVSNTASKATFSANASSTIGGAFLTTDNTKSGTTGTLVGVAAISPERALTNGDTLNVTVTASTSSS